MSPAKQLPVWISCMVHCTSSSIWCGKRTSGVTEHLLGSWNQTLEKLGSAAFWHLHVYTAAARRDRASFPWQLLPAHPTDAGIQKQCCVIWQRSVCLLILYEGSCHRGIQLPQRNEVEPPFLPSEVLWFDLNVATNWLAVDTGAVLIMVFIFCRRHPSPGLNQAETG